MSKPPDTRRARAATASFGTLLGDLLWPALFVTVALLAAVAALSQPQDVARLANAAGTGIANAVGPVGERIWRESGWYLGPIADAVTFPGRYVFRTLHADVDSGFDWVVIVGVSAWVWRKVGVALGRGFTWASPRTVAAVRNWGAGLREAGDAVNWMLASEGNQPFVHGAVITAALVVASGMFLSAFSGTEKDPVVLGILGGIGGLVALGFLGRHVMVNAIHGAAPVILRQPGASLLAPYPPRTVLAAAIFIGIVFVIGRVVGSLPKPSGLLEQIAAGLGFLLFLPLALGMFLAMAALVTVFLHLIVAAVIVAVERRNIDAPRR